MTEAVQNYVVPTPKAAIPDIRVAVLGAGKMGGILLQAFLKNTLVDAENITATVGHAERAVALSAQFGVQVTTDNKAAAKGANVVILGVKPWQVPALLAEIKPSIAAGTLLLSIAAGVKISEMEEAAGKGVAVIRAMPNTPAMLTAGMTAFCRGTNVTDAQMKIAQRIFETVGRAVVVEEKHMDAVTGLSGSGPAFFYIIIEALAEGGVNMGLPRDTATLLAAQTMFGVGTDGAGDGLSSGDAEGRCDDACGQHGGRHPCAGRGWPARGADSGGAQGDSAGEGIGEGLACFARSCMDYDDAWVEKRVLRLPLRLTPFAQGPLRMRVGKLKAASLTRCGFFFRSGEISRREISGRGRR